MEPSLVITVHGIRTFGQWQDRLSSLLENSGSKFQTENYTYGYFSVIAFLIPPLRWLSVRRFKSELKRIIRRHPGKRITLVGHSFGTHLIGWGLYGLSKDRSFPCIDTVILAGSVLRSSFPWGALIETGSVRKIINDCGINDSVLILSQFCVLFTGMAGRIGFTGMTGKQLTNRFHNGGHSLYFERGGKADNRFMIKFWLPLLLEDSVLAQDDRKTKGPLQGAYITLLQNADVLKVFVYVSIGWAVIHFGYLRPRELAAVNGARADREAAQRMRQVATASFSAGTAIPSAVAAIQRAGLLEKANPADYQKVLSYWLPTLTPIDELLKTRPNPTLIYWHGENIFVNNQSQHLLSGRQMTGYVLTYEKDKLLTFDVDNVVKIYSVPDLSILASFPLEVKERAAQAGQNSKLSNDDTEMLTDDYVEPLDSIRVIEISKGKRFLLQGTRQSASAGGETPKIIVLDLQNKTQGALGLADTEVISTDETCSHMLFRRRTDNRKAFKYFVTDFTLKNDNIVTYPISKKDVVKHLKAFRDNLTYDHDISSNLCEKTRLGVPVSSNDEENPQGLAYESSFQFPLVTPENEFWTEIAQKQSSKPSPEHLKVETYKGIANSASTDYKKILASQLRAHVFLTDGEAPESAFETVVMRTRYGDFFRFVNAAGAQYGETTVCQSNQSPHRCISYSYHGDFGKFSASSDGKYITLTDAKSNGHNPLAILDVVSSKELAPDIWPEETALAAAFSADDSILVVRTANSIAIYDVGDSIKLRKLVRLNTEEISEDGNAAQKPLTISGDIAVLGFSLRGAMGINIKSGQRAWALADLGLGENPSFQGGQVDDIIVAFSDNALRLLEASKGIPLTRTFDFAQSGKDSETDTEPSIDEITVLDDGSLKVRTKSATYERHAPMSIKEVASVISSGLESRVGADSDFGEVREELLPIPIILPKSKK